MNGNMKFEFKNVKKLPLSDLLQLLFMDYDKKCWFKIGKNETSKFILSFTCRFNGEYHNTCPENFRSDLISVKCDADLSLIFENKKGKSIVIPSVMYSNDMNNYTNFLDAEEQLKKKKLNSLKVVLTMLI